MLAFSYHDLGVFILTTVANVFTLSVCWGTLVGVGLAMTVRDKTQFGFSKL